MGCMPSRWGAVCVALSIMVEVDVGARDARYSWAVVLRLLRAVVVAPAVGLVVLTSSAPAAAELPGVSLHVVESRGVRVIEKRYQLQTLVFDGIALGTLVATRSLKVARVPYVLGPPIVHFAHGNIGPGVASAGLRIAPLWLIHRANVCMEEYTPVDDGVNYDDGTVSCLDDFFLGFLSVLALPLVSAFDAAALARKKVRVEPELTWSLAPSYDHRRGEGGLWVAGHF